MGVGKTTVSQQLKKDLANSVFLDGGETMERAAGKTFNFSLFVCA